MSFKALLNFIAQLSLFFRQTLVIYTIPTLISSRQCKHYTYFYDLWIHFWQIYLQKVAPLQNYSRKPEVPKIINSIIHLNQLYLIILLKLILANFSPLRFYQYSIFFPLLSDIIFMKYYVLVLLISGAVWCRN